MKILIFKILRNIINCAVYIFLAVKYFKKVYHEKGFFQKYKRILLIDIHGIGDLIMLTPVIEQIKIQYPMVYIDILVRSIVAPIFENDKRIENIIVINEKKWWRSIKKIREKQYDVLTVFQGGIISSFFLFLVKTDLITGMIYNNPNVYAHSGKYIPYRKNNLDQNIHMFDSIRAAVRLYINIPALSKYSLDLRTSNSSNINKYINLPYLVIAPETGWKIKDIPDNFLNNLIDKLIELDYNIVILGLNKSDKNAVDLKNFNLFDLRGKTSLIESLEILKIAKLVICADSSFMHAAAAFNIPSILFFGPTNPQKLVPKNGNSSLYYRNLYCSPCYKNINIPKCVNEEYKACMNFNIDIVLTGILEVINGLK